MRRLRAHWGKRTPWAKRAEQERKHADAALQRLEEVRADTEKMSHRVARVKREIEINGFLQGVLELNRGRGQHG